jgi:hypothetical protein
MMEETGKNSTPESSSTLISGVHKKFVYEIYQDFQEYIYKKSKSPTSIIMREPDNSLSPCYPREWNRGFCEFCKELRDKSHIPYKNSICVQQQKDHIHMGINNEDHGKKWEWGWRKCHMGLYDFFIPIRSTIKGESSGSILSVLIVGHYRGPDKDSLDFINKRVDEITTGNDWEKYFPGIPLESREAYAKKLHDLAKKIPLKYNDQIEKLESKIKESVELMEIIATRTLNRGLLSEGEEFIQSLGLDKININVGEKKLWHEVGTACSKIINYFKLESAVFYSSYYSDYTDLKRRLSLPFSVGIPDAIGLPSYKSFKWLTEQNFVTLPHLSEHIYWLTPQTYFKTDTALLFAREMHDGHLIIAGFGSNAEKPLNTLQETIIHEAVNNKVFRFIEIAILGITLDQLMSETGHLMGRAYGKVALGAGQLRKFAPHIHAPDHEKILEQSFWAIEDGITRLDLIRSNFYAFKSHRLRTEKLEDLEQTGKFYISDSRDQITGDTNLPEALKMRYYEEGKTEIDIVAVLDGLKNFFNRSIKDTRLKPNRYFIECKRAITIGPQDGENKLRLIFLNLFDNAMKFAYEGTAVDISCTRIRSTCDISFTNLGIGVAQDEFNLVFQRLAKSRFKDPMRRTEGLGLGLPYCQRIIQNEFKGNISLISQPAKTPHPRRFAGDNWITKVTVKLNIAK